MIITISGMPGSGKSTVAKILVEKLNAERIYVGGIRRELARMKGMTLEELNHYAQTHPETDVDIDKMAAEKALLLEREGRVVVDEGRTQFHFLSQSIKIYIKVSVEEGARRIWQDLQQHETSEQRNEGKIGSFDEMKKSIMVREEEDAFRYKKYYDIDHRDEKQYDLVVDSTSISAVECAETVLTFIQSKKKV